MAKQCEWIRAARDKRKPTQDAINYALSLAQEVGADVDPIDVSYMTKWELRLCCDELRDETF